MEMQDSFTWLTNFGDPIQQCVMPLIVMKDGKISPVGTGFMIGVDGLMMTATHVLDEALKWADTKENDDGTIETLLEFYALWISAERHGEKNDNLGGPMPIHRIWKGPELDIGYCWVTRPFYQGKPLPLQFPVFRLSPGLPKVGDHNTGFGYYSIAAFVDNNFQGDKRVINYAQDTALTQGQIIEVHPVRRDNAMLHFPCFHTNARFEHGMSGGPILNIKGDVCGVICSSIPYIDDATDYVSYGSLIWLALGISVEVASHEGAPPEYVLVYDLIQRGSVLSDDTISHVHVVMNGTERTVRVRK